MGIIGDLISAGTTLAGAYSQIKTNDLNYQLQKENLEYQKTLQQTIFGREDNAVQRRVADLKAAGLSPTLAAGSSASAGQAISTRAPEKRSNLEALSAIASVRTLIAQQQEAQTQADIARQKLEQEKKNTQYMKDKGLSPVEINQSWQQRLLNLLAPKIEQWANRSTIPEVVDEAMKNLGDNVKRVFSEGLGNIKNLGAEKPDVSYSSGKVTKNDTGESLSDMQVALLKQKGMYSLWLKKGFTPEIVKVLGSGSRR